MRSSIRALLALFAGVALIPLAAHAQDLSNSEGVMFTVNASSTAGDQIPIRPAGPAATPEHTGVKALFKDFGNDVKHVPSTNNAIILGIGGAAALAVHPADDNVTPYLIDASWAHRTFGFGAILGDSPTLIGLSLGTYAWGRIRDEKTVSHVGMDMLQAIMLEEMIVETMKYSTRRQRPDGSGANSFPSGHAAGTFAVATALERHASWKLWAPAYAGAAYVAMSRLHDNRHYLSDVVFGAAVGTMVGRTVTRPGHALPITVVPVRGGAAIAYVKNGN